MGDSKALDVGGIKSPGMGVGLIIVMIGREIPVWRKGAEPHYIPYCRHFWVFQIYAAFLPKLLENYKFWKSRKWKRPNKYLTFYKIEYFIWDTFLDIVFVLLFTRKLTIVFSFYLFGLQRDHNNSYFFDQESMKRRSQYEIRIWAKVDTS